jgi:serine protease Do
MEGKVIGINTAIVAQGQGIGFAIPINMAKTVLPDLKAKGKVTRAWLGVSVQDVTDDIAKSFQLKESSGALVSEVFKGDPADKAGLRTGDLITEVNGKKIKDTHELLLTIASFHVGDKVEIKALRDGQEKTFLIIVTERRDQPEVASAEETAQNFGMVIQDITPEIARYLGITSRSGVIVVDVKDGSIADEKGIQPQDIILEVNKVKISSVKDYSREITKKSAKQGVLLLIKRGKAKYFVSLSK